MDNCDPRFEPLLSRFDTNVFELCASPVYGMWPDFTLAYSNQAWFVFAAANGGEPGISHQWGLGSNVLKAIDDPLRGYFRTAMQGCREDGTPWTHSYECPSATQHREFGMRVYPLRNRGYLVVHSQLSERQHDRASHWPEPAIDEVYASKRGLILQCMHCRRTQRGDRSSQWDWVPAWVEQRPQNASGGLCPACSSHYFGGSAVRAS